MTTSGRRVAFLTHTPPLPLWSGERIRSWYLLSELVRRDWDVSLFSLLHTDTAPSPADRTRLEETLTEVVLAPFSVSTARRRARVLRDLALRRPFQAGFFLDPEAVDLCRRWLDARAFDVVVVAQLYMAPYVPEGRYSTCLLDTHNSEARRLETMATALGTTSRGIAARLQRKPVARYERRVAAQVARVVAVSEQDSEYFERIAPGRVDIVPNGVDCEALTARPAPPDEPRLLFVGSLDYSANVDAVSYLARDILGRLPAGVTVDVVGSNPRRAVHRLAEESSRVRIVGQVPDTTPYWEHARAFVVPLRVGGGTRLKILEALARGVPVVSTSLGCEGLGLRVGEDLLVADLPAEFAAAVSRLLEDDDLCRRIATGGRATVEARYDWRTIGDAFEASVAAVVSTP